MNESIVPVSGWRNEDGNTERNFERISVFNGKSGGEEFDLAPDSQRQAAGRIVQIWNLKGYRSMNLFLRCRYHDTAAVLWMDLPLQVQTCTLRFQIDSQGRITGKSSMECR